MYSNNSTKKTILQCAINTSILFCIFCIFLSCSKKDDEKNNGNSTYNSCVETDTNFTPTITVTPDEEDSLKTAVENASSGDIILVKDGTYTVRYLSPVSGITIISENGPLKTKIYSEYGRALSIVNKENITVKGFEIYSKQTNDPATDGLVYIDGSSNITIKNSIIHDGPRDADVVKIRGSQDVLLENCIIYNPSERKKAPGKFQENIDIRGQGDERITIRGCWLFHVGDWGDYLIYAKGGTKNVLWENNVFGPSAGKGWENVAVESGHIGNTDNTPYETEYMVIRNNLFVDLKGSAAFGFAGPNVALLYNNVFYKNTGVKNAIIEIDDNPGSAGGPALNIYSINNIFSENISSDSKKFFRVRDEASGDNLIHDYNVYYSNYSNSDLSISVELNSVFDEKPLFTSPSVPVYDPKKGVEQIKEILAGFRLNSSSPAIGEGVNVFSFTGTIHPTGISDMSTREDAFCNSRKSVKKWDIGLHQVSK